MANRSFKDASGVDWQAWDVIPGQHTHDPGEARRHLPGGMADGWLCFESGKGKRRLTPIPEGWADVSDAELEALCRSATSVRSRTRQAG
jgi:hypothetical protein